MYNKEIEKFLLEPNGSLKKIFPFVLKNANTEEWAREIYSAPGKILTQKIYNVYHNIKTIPTCNNCGSALKFLGFTEGYSKDCKNCRKSTINSVTTNIDVSGITPGHPKVISKEEDFTNNTCSSQILTTCGAQDEMTLLKEHGFNPAEWRIIKAKHSMWDNGAKDLYASSIQVAKRNFGDLPEKDMFDRINSAVNFKPSKLPLYPPIEGDKRILVVPIADFHYGLLAKSETTGNEYNMDVAEERLTSFVSSIIHKYKSVHPDEIVLTFGNDYFNADNLIGTTTKGTPQDQDGPYFNIFDKGVELAINVVESLKPITNHIYISSVQANHDKQTSHALIAAIYYKYQGDKNITVDMTSDKIARYYIRRGKCLFGFGHETKVKDCARLMSVESPDWSFTNYKTFFIAHLHHEESKDTGGITVRRIPTMCGISTWTRESGFSDASAHAQTYLYSTEAGLIELFNVELD